MPKIAYMFPGQGSQKVGMGHEIYERSEDVRRLFKEAEEILGYDIAKICFEGPADVLNDTVYTQPALYVVEFAMFKYLLDNGLRYPDFMFGHSLGEIPALACAGALSFKDGLRLVKRRGELMAEAGRKHPGKLAAIIGLTKDALEDIVRQVDGVVVLANLNSPQQIVVSGESDAVDAVAKKAKEAGAKRAVVLKVSVAAHSPLMKEAAEQFEDELNRIEIKRPKVPVIQNVTAQPTYEPETIRRNLALQLISPVRWVDTLTLAWKLGVRTFVEIGPGKVLSGLAKRTLPSEVEIISIQTGTETLPEVLTMA